MLWSGGALGRTRNSAPGKGLSWEVAVDVQPCLGHVSLRSWVWESPLWPLELLQKLLEAGWDPELSTS